MPPHTPKLYLCAGLQSSGSTLISWCFLQRRDMNGILDGNNDILTTIPAGLTSPSVWLKTTISSFRLSEQIAYYQDFGWTVTPLLVCRDVRAAYASLRVKRYGINGTTAEDPPLRLRFRRFREDWELFQDRGWPILRYETFLGNPEAELREACAQLALPWDDAMLTWPKPKSAIFDTRHGNDTFRKSCGNNLSACLKPSASQSDLVIPAAELAWLEEEFATFNQVNHYPARIPVRRSVTAAEDRDRPSFVSTRRFLWRQQPLTLQYAVRAVVRWLKGKPVTRVPRSPQSPVVEAIRLRVPQLREQESPSPK